MLNGFRELGELLRENGRIVQHGSEWWEKFRQEWMRLEAAEERLSRAIHHWQQQQ